MNKIKFVVNLPPRNTNGTLGGSIKHLNVEKYLYIIYFIVTTLSSYMMFFRHSLSTSRYIFGLGQDPMQYVWFIRWWPYALSHLINPFITTIQWAPKGYNLALTTSVPLLSFLLWPITYVWGPLTAFNIITILAPSLTATITMMLFHGITNKYFPSVVGGWIFGFSPYELGQLQGHLHLNFIFFIPLSLLIVWWYKNKIVTATYSVTLLTIALIGQMWTSLELFSTATYCSFFALLVWFTLDRKNGAEVLGILKIVTLSYFFALLLSLPYLYYFTIGIQHAPAGFPFAQNKI